ncbi:MAG: GNAT family N-acetyltransferase [Eubacteriales bacterium]|nr:GNAT family N-acetyltransferase [Eubacteriales bacterium]
MNAEIDIRGVKLYTPRLTLREWDMSDLEDFFEYASVKGVGEMAGWSAHKNTEETQEILNSFIEQKKTFAIVYNNKVIGSIGVEKYDEEILPEFHHKKGREIGYVLSKDYWGQGLMPEAVKEVIRWLFENKELDFIVCGHFDENIQSQKVQEKCGFTHYRRKKFDTRYGDVKHGWLSILER